VVSLGRTTLPNKVSIELFIRVSPVQDAFGIVRPADRFIASILQPGFVPNQIGAVIC
jgi:hypothetical protein